MSREVGSSQKVGAYAFRVYPHMQKMALCKLKRGTLYTNLSTNGGVPPVPLSSYVHDYAKFKSLRKFNGVNVMIF